MQDFKCQIILELNSMGYHGEEINHILPDFMAERKTTIGLTWESSAEGSETFNLLIQIGILISIVTKGFLNELGKDLYGWVKSQLISFFQKKSQPVGRVRIEFEDVNVELFMEFSQPKDYQFFAQFFLDLPVIISEIDPNFGYEWDISWDEKTNSWMAKPLNLPEDE